MIRMAGEEVSNSNDVLLLMSGGLSYKRRSAASIYRLK